MKRDPDLIRKILMKIEETPYSGDFFEVEIEEYSPDEISYHVLLLREAGYVIAEDASVFGSMVFLPSRLTWDGHEFLEASRDDKVWNKAKTLLLEKGGGLVFDLLKEVLVGLIKDNIKDVVGIP